MVLLVQVEFALECTSPIKALTLAETIRQQIADSTIIGFDDSLPLDTEVTVRDYLDERIIAISQ